MADSERRLPPGLALAWGVVPVGRRGPKPAHDVAKIISAALELADERGLSAVSMPKVAARVGVTANALYGYIGSKDELLVLLEDAAWAAPPASLGSAESWRDAATIWVHAIIAGLLERPWLLDLPVRGAPLTPGLLRWVEALLQSMADTGLSVQDRLGCATLLDGYARRTAALARDLAASEDPASRSAAVGEFLLPLLHERGFPVLASMISAGAYDDEEGVTADDVDFGLHRILDGIEALIRSTA